MSNLVIAALSRGFLGVVVLEPVESAGVGVVVVDVAAAVVGVAGVESEKARTNCGSQKYEPTSNSRPSAADFGALAFRSFKSCS